MKGKHLQHPDWSEKWHGFYWGWYQHKPDDDNTQWIIDNYNECRDITQTTGEHHCFKFGNEWGKKRFQHPNTIPHSNWHFVDNPQLSCLNWPGPWNEKGRKFFVRATQGTILTQQPRRRGTDRINRILTEMSLGKTCDWRDIVPYRKQKRPTTTQAKNSRRALLVCSSPPNYEHYYNTTMMRWIEGARQLAQSQGYTVDIRVKQGRKHRREGTELCHQLWADRYDITISQHSVAAIDSILAGTPAVVTGPHCAGELATPWEEFSQGHLRTEWNQDDIFDWCDYLLGETHHKQELWNGTYL